MDVDKKESYYLASKRIEICENRGLKIRWTWGKTIKKRKLNRRMFWRNKSLKENWKYYSEISKIRNFDDNTQLINNLRKKKYSWCKYSFGIVDLLVATNFYIPEHYFHLTKYLNRLKVNCNIAWLQVQMKKNIVTHTSSAALIYGKQLCKRRKNPKFKFSVAFFLTTPVVDWHNFYFNIWSSR